MKITKPVPLASLVILIVLLAGACGPIIPGQGETETATSAPTFTPVPPTATETPMPEFTSVPATVIPTQPPPPILTPDAIQVERWQEYQTELAKALFVHNPSFPIWGYGPDAYTDALCEWDILRQLGQEVYVWATCIPAANSPLKGNSRVVRQNPAVIYLEPDGAIQKINIASEELSRVPHPHLIYDIHLFPIDIQETLCQYYFVNVPQCGEITNPAYLQLRQSVLVSHLKYREIYPAEPPLVVLSVMPTANSTP